MNFRNIDMSLVFLYVGIILLLVVPFTALAYAEYKNDKEFTEICRTQGRIYREVHGTEYCQDSDGGLHFAWERVP